MVIKVKVSDVAKDLGKQNKDIIELLSAYCDGPAKKAGTVLTENELNVVFDKITQENSVKNFDSYFASKKQDAKKESKKSKPAKNSEKDKKRQSQAAILQMAEQAAKRLRKRQSRLRRQEQRARHATLTQELTMLTLKNTTKNTKILLLQAI